MVQIINISIKTLLYSDYHYHQYHHYYHHHHHHHHHHQHQDITLNIMIIMIITVMIITDHLHVSILVAELEHVPGLPGDGGGPVQLPLSVVPLLHLATEHHFQNKVLTDSLCDLA